MEDFRAMKTELTNNSKDWSAAEWKKFIVNFEKTDSLLSTFDLTAEEKQEIEKIKSQCTLKLLKGKAIVAAEEVKDAINGIIGGATEEAEGVVDEAKSALEGSINDAKQAAKDAANDMKEATKDAAKKAVNNASEAVQGVIDDLTK